MVRLELTRLTGMTTGLTVNSIGVVPPTLLLVNPELFGFVLALSFIDLWQEEVTTTPSGKESGSLEVLVQCGHLTLQQ